MAERGVENVAKTDGRSGDKVLNCRQAPRKAEQPGKNSSPLFRFCCFALSRLRLDGPLAPSWPSGFRESKKGIPKKGD
jgi:hypothetical protein